MSLKYKFVTPLTSMVVTKPEDNADKTALADKPLEGKDTYFTGRQLFQLISCSSDVFITKHWKHTLCIDFINY